MMQGRKKYQRRQWIRRQEFYFGTKYLINHVTNNTFNNISWRSYNAGSDATIPFKNEITIVPFYDMYIATRFGNTSTPSRERVKAGQAKTLTVNMSNPAETQILIYGASGIASFGDPE